MKNLKLLPAPEIARGTGLFGACVIAAAQYASHTTVDAVAVHACDLYEALDKELAKRNA